MFLSRLLTTAERNYWFTKLKIADLIWIVKKIRHFIQSSKKSVIIQTNHVVIINICKQTFITFINFVMRMNLRLIRVSQFLSQFSNLKIRHKSDKYHLISNVLSRLQSLNKSDLSDDHDELNEFFADHIETICVYMIILTKLSDDFRKRIIDDYSRDNAWLKIIRIIDDNVKLSVDAAQLSFIREKFILVFSSESNSYFKSRTKRIDHEFDDHKKKDENLIYHVDRETDIKRLCISSSCVKNILNIAHENDHLDFEASFEIISRSWYIRELFKNLRQYIKHCSQCLVIQTRRHKFWKSLQSIHSSSISFHTVAMNFVLRLFVNNEEFDCVLSMIDKFITRIMLISEKSIYFVENWFIYYLQKLNRRDWRISKIIIFDRDRKFLSNFWHKLFINLDVSMFYFIVYHSQIDDASERINQSMKIVLRYYIQQLFDVSLWVFSLWTFQAVVNNIKSARTDKISNELLYEIISNRSLNLMKFSTKIDHFHDHLRKKTQNVINWAQMMNKVYYDRRHTPLFLKIDEWALLRLHHDYFVSSFKNMTKKVFAQYVDSFKVLKRINRLIYRLNISSNWIIHFVFIVAQLELASSSQSDSFEKFRSSHSSSVKDTQDEYEVERLLNKRIIRKKKKYVTKYLIRWKDYESEFDTWYNLKNLDDVKNLVSDYEKTLRV